MEGPEITFLFQFGMVRDTVTVASNMLTLKTLKDMACDFINTKVSPCTTYQASFTLFDFSTIFYYGTVRFSYYFKMYMHIAIKMIKFESFILEISWK